MQQQLISKPTHITNHSESLLDVLFTSDVNIFGTTGTTVLTGSDHLMIFGETTAKIQSQVKVSTVRSFKKCNKDEILTDLDNAPWHTIKVFDSIDDKCNYWKTLFFSIIDNHAPLVRVRTKRKEEGGEWIDSELRNFMRTRNYYRKKYRKTHCQADCDDFKSLRKEVKYRMCRAKADHFRRVCSNISQQPKLTWSQLNTALGRSKTRSINTLRKVITKATDIVRCIDQHFGSILTSSSGEFSCRLSPMSSRFKFSSISEDVVLKKLTTLNEKKATGPDQISAKHLRMGASSISPSITSLFNSSISQGVFPNAGKKQMCPQYQSQETGVLRKTTSGSSYSQSF